MNDMNYFLTCIQFTLYVLHCKCTFHVNILQSMLYLAYVHSYVKLIWLLMFH